MLHYSDFIINFMNYYSYPDEAVEVFSNVLKRLDDEKDFGEKIDALVERYIKNENENLDAVLDEVTSLAEEKAINQYTLHFVFLLLCTPDTFENYKKNGIPENLFWDTFWDFKYKLIECIKCEEVWGTFVAGWNNGFFRLNRFTFGRFQFELSTYGGNVDYVTRCGKMLKKGDVVIGFHIPSSGVPLSDEIRMDSYRKAYEYYKKYFSDGLVVFDCGSWLLYPKHKEFLPEKSNILRFMDDFEMLTWSEKSEFHDGWRVFDKDSDLPPEKLPRDTSLRRAFADRLIAGLPVGSGSGVIVFDGEKIVR